MQTDHKPDGGRGASLFDRRFGTEPETKIDFAVDLLRTVGLALRARDYLEDRGIESISDVTDFAVDLITDARSATGMGVGGGR